MPYHDDMTQQYPNSFLNQSLPTVSQFPEYFLSYKQVKPIINFEWKIAELPELEINSVNLFRSKIG